VLTCQHQGGTAWQAYSTDGLTLEAGQAYTWGRDGEPTIHRGSSCNVQLSTTAASDDLSGTVSVCGQVVDTATWSGSFGSAARR